MTATTLNPLSTNDLAILGAIFDPETSLSRSSNNHTSTSPIRSSNTNISTTISPELLSAEKAILKTLNTPDPSPTTLTNAITELSILITTNPTHSSLYTNRAQATRLLPSSLTTPNLLRSILSDLHAAITIIASAPTTPRSTSTLITAHTHRAYILLSISQNPSQFTTFTSLDTLGLGLPSQEKVTPSKLEDLASRDFSVAAALGDEDARKMSVKTNPYAKMCGAIVREALREEIRGFYEGK